MYSPPSLDTAHRAAPRDTRERPSVMFGLVVTRASWLPRIASVRGTAALRGFASEGVAGGPSATSSSAEVAAAGAAAAAVGGGSFGGIGGIGGAFRTAFSVVLAGATAVIVEDTLNDLVLWNICKSHAMPVIEGHPRLQRSLVRRARFFGITHMSFFCFLVSLGSSSSQFYYSYHQL